MKMAEIKRHFATHAKHIRALARQGNILLSGVASAGITLAKLVEILHKKGVLNDEEATSVQNAGREGLESINNRSEEGSAVEGNGGDGQPAIPVAAGDRDAGGNPSDAGQGTTVSGTPQGNGTDSPV